jgi:hypothetical protein
MQLRAALLLRFAHKEAIFDFLRQHREEHFTFGPSEIFGILTGCNICVNITGLYRSIALRQRIFRMKSTNGVAAGHGFEWCGSAGEKTARNRETQCRRTAPIIPVVNSPLCGV